MHQSSRGDTNCKPTYSIQESGSASSIERAWISLPSEETGQTLWLSFIQRSPHVTLRTPFQIGH